MRERRSMGKPAKAIYFIAVAQLGLTYPAASQTHPLDQGASSQEQDAAILAQLSRSPDDPALHFFKALHHESSSTMQTEGRELARVGYLMALRQDGGFWRAAYQLGLMSLEERDASTAKIYLLTAALQAPREARIFYALARASYCAGDLVTATAALEKAEAIRAHETTNELVTAALIRGATGDVGLAQQFIGLLNPSLQKAVQTRLESPHRLQPTVMDKVSPTQTKVGPRMALLDVVIIRRNESAGSTNGLNLLDSLSIQFGSELINRSWSKTRDYIEPSAGVDSLASTGNLQLSIPAVTYALNLANARGNESKVEARPTLLIYDGIESKLFNGGTLTFSTEGQLSSSAETREVGVNLSVKPRFDPDDTVNLSVNVTLENFFAGQPEGTFNQAVQTEKSSTTVSADLRFGQTMLVSGGTKATFSSSRSKAPVLGDIPLIGKLFNTRTQSRQDNDLLILISLRRSPASGVQPSVYDNEKLEDLRQRAFPGISSAQLYEPEVSRIFYQIDNPARMYDVNYLNDFNESKYLKKFVDFYASNIWDTPK